MTSAADKVTLYTGDVIFLSTAFDEGDQKPGYGFMCADGFDKVRALDTYLLAHNIFALKFTALAIDAPAFPRHSPPLPTVPRSKTRFPY